MPLINWVNIVIYLIRLSHRLHFNSCANTGSIGTYFGHVFLMCLWKLYRPMEKYTYYKIFILFNTFFGKGLDQVLPNLFFCHFSSFILLFIKATRSFFTRATPMSLWVHPAHVTCLTALDTARYFEYDPYLLTLRILRSMALWQILSRDFSHSYTPYLRIVGQDK